MQLILSIRQKYKIGRTLEIVASRDPSYQKPSGSISGLTVVEASVSMLLVFKANFVC